MESVFDLNVATLRCWDSQRNVYYEVKVDRADVKLLAAACDVERLRTTIADKKSGGVRTPYALYRDLKNPTLRARYKHGNVAITHILLDLSPSQARVRHLNGDSLDCRRENLKLGTSTGAEARRGRLPRAVDPAAPGSVSAFEIAREPRDVYVVRVSGRERGVFLTSQEAREQLATILIDGLPSKGEER